MREARKGDLAILAPWAAPYHEEAKAKSGCAITHQRQVFEVLTEPVKPNDPSFWRGFAGKIVQVRGACGCQGWTNVKNLIPIDKGNPDQSSSTTDRKEIAGVKG